jgi:predicted nucleotidyltransferase
MKKEYEDLIKKVFKEAKKYYGENLVSFAIFGSVARGTSSPYSDIDLIIISENLPSGRTKRINEFIENIEIKIEGKIKEMKKKGIFTALSPIIKTPEEVKKGSFLFLDMIEDSIILYDRDNFFKNYLMELKEKLKKYGAKKIYKKGGYYWIIKKDFNLKEGIEI